LAVNSNRRASDPLAGLYRHQTNMPPAVGVFLGQDSDVGHEQEPAILDRLNRFVLGWVPSARDQKEKSALAPAVRWFAQLFGKIEGRIISFPFIFESDRLVLDCDSRNVFFVEQARFVKLRVLEFASRLADEVIDLGSCNASDFVLDCRQAPRANRQFPFSA